jgi:hypothetical protein
VSLFILATVLVWKVKAALLEDQSWSLNLGPNLFGNANARTEALLTRTVSFTVDEAQERPHYSCWNIFPTLPVYRDVRRLLPTNVVTS